VLLFAFLPTGLAQQAGPPQVTSQRSSFTYGTTTTAPGSIETEFGTLGPWGTFTLPTSFKFTPPSETGLFHGTEFSLSFDTVERMVQGNSGAYKFGQTLDFAIRRPVYVGKHFSFALAPRAEFFLRDGSGANVGGVTIAAYAFGLNSLTVNLTGMAASAPSRVDPPWEVDTAYGYGRSFGESGLTSRFSLAIEAQHEVPNGSPNKTSLLQSVSYSIRPNLAFDIGVEQHGLQAGDFQWVFRGGFAYNIGYLWRR
jgi:hypothetical protein